MDIPIKKIYIDSRFTSSDSKSHTDFSYDLGTTFSMPNNNSFYMDDVNIPNSWYSVEENRNNRMYFRWKDKGSNLMRDEILYLPTNTYDGDLFVSALQAIFNTQLASYVNGVKTIPFTALYDAAKNKLNIRSSTVTYFKVLSDEELISQ